MKIIKSVKKKNSHLMFYCYQILCFSMSNYLNAYNTFFFSYSSLMKKKISEILCTFYWLSDEDNTLI